MRFLLLGLAASLPLVACAPTPPRADTRSPDSPPGVRQADPGYRDMKPDLDPTIPRRTPASRSADRPTVPILTD